MHVSVNGNILTEAYLEACMERYGLPNYMAGGLYLYLTENIAPGSFLTALLSNDLRESVARADSNNARCLKEWVQFLYCECPSNSWGSPEKVKQWLSERKMDL